MGARCLLYYITDRTQLPGDETARRRALLEKIGEAARAGVDFVQLREKDLSTRDLEELAREAGRLLSDLRIEDGERRTRLLINSRTDVAFAAGADGVHLRGVDVSPSTVRFVWAEAADRAAALASGRAGRESCRPLVAVSCHNAADVCRAESEGADFVVLAPIFGKRDAPNATPAGLAALREACRAEIPVLALGAVTLQNAEACREAGAAGVAGIRLFQENRISEVVRALRAL